MRQGPLAKWASLWSNATLNTEKLGYTFEPDDFLTSWEQGEEEAEETHVMNADEQLAYFRMLTASMGGREIILPPEA